MISAQNWKRYNQTLGSLQPPPPKLQFLATSEQRHLYANKAKTEVRHFCLKQLTNEIHACKNEIGYNILALFKSPLWMGVNKNGVSNFLRSIVHFCFVRSNCWGPVTSENKYIWAPKPCIMRSFGLKMRQKQVREIFRKVCQTCFCAIVAVCRRDF